MLFIVLVRRPVHTPVRAPMYELPLSQPVQRIRSVFQSVYNNKYYEKTRFVSVAYTILIYGMMEISLYAFTAI